MKSIRCTRVPLVSALCILITACGPDIAIPDAPVVTGNWLITGYYATDSVISPLLIGGLISDAGGQVSGVFHVDLPCFGNGATDIPYTGTHDAKNHLSIRSSSVDGQVLALRGSLSGDRSTLSDGFFTITGGCTGNLVSLTGSNGPGSSFTPTGFRINPLTGSWAAHTNSSLNLTENLTQALTPDIHGNFALSGTVTVQGSPCFSYGTLQPGSFVGGYLGQQVILMNDGSVLKGSMVLEVSAVNTKPELSLHPADVTGGNCNGPVDIRLQ